MYQINDANLLIFDMNVKNPTVSSVKMVKGMYKALMISIQTPVE
jgi:hypothetical protein